ncbi:MAG TPA: DUF4142 domain-containing protein [Gemmatimonadaceae bacterium]|nr:DUF4142 domain-containing protein [Gemmatimonadaceae bacterium]
MRARATMGLGAALLTLACGGGERSASGSDSVATGGAGTVAEAPGAGDTALVGTTSGAAGASAPGGVRLGDASILYALDLVHASDSAGGALASRKASDAEVRAYGARMVADHHRLREELQRLGDALRLTPTPPAGDRREAQAKEAMDTLQKAAPGPAWDLAYLAHEIAAHQQAMDLAAQALNSTRRRELVSYLDRASPVMRGHLDRAVAIQRRLAGG